MGDVHVSDQRTITYVRLIKGSVWYYIVLFHMIDTCFMYEQSFVLVRHMTRGCITYEGTFASFAYFIIFFNFYFTKGNYIL